MLFYALCDAFVVILKILNFFEALEHSVAVMVDALYNYSYDLIMPIQSCSVSDVNLAAYYVIYYLVQTAIGSGLELIETALIVSRYPNVRKVLLGWKLTTKKRVSAAK
ncbi:hypothetical protein COOONC_04906 [Cooperia oncophora]